MSLPPPVNRYLDRLFVERTRPFAMRVDTAYAYVDSWGDPGRSGLDRLEIGDDVREFAPWLAGLDLREPLVLSYVDVGDKGVFHVHIVPARDAAFVVLLGAGEELELKRRLQQTANEVRLLNRRQATLVRQLEAARAEAEERQREVACANAIKARFIAGMSHEFRTPLTSVLGYAELILEHVNEQPTLGAHAEAITRAAGHLLSMVDNVLDQARLEQGDVELHISAVNVRHLADDLAAIVAPLAAARLLGFGAYVESRVPEHALTDAVRVRQILLNVLGNAVKFTDSGEVRLEIDWHDGQLIAVISDTGPGIAIEEQRRIFDEFQRGASSTGTRGSGLGLTISRGLLHALGGEIDLDSAPGEGSRFTIRMPAPAVAAPLLEATAVSPLRRAGERASVLVAEDDPDVIELLQIILRRANHRVTIARNGHEAIESALSTSPDLVLMDVNMPELDGLSAARELRRRGFERPIVALTASLGAMDRGQALIYGCDGYLLKPVSSSQLLLAIDRYLETA